MDLLRASSLPPYSAINLAAPEVKKFLDDAEEVSQTIINPPVYSSSTPESSRSRFVAVSFLPSRGFAAKARFFLWLCRLVCYVDRFVPGTAEEPSATVKISPSPNWRYRTYVS